MKMNNEQIYLKDVHLLTTKEKDEVINKLREKVNSLESQKNSYKKLSDDTIYSYERMKELYEIQNEKSKILKDQNQILFNDINFLRYEVNAFGDDTQNIRDDNISSMNKQLNFESPMSRKHILGGYNGVQSFSLNFQSAANGLNNLNSNNPKIDASNPQYLKNIRTLSRQFSTNSASSNGGSANPNLELRKLMEENEEPEKIQLNNGAEQLKKKSHQNIPSSSQESKVGENEKYNPSTDESKRLASENHFRLTANVGELLFQDFLLIGPSLDEINGKCEIGRGGINAQNQENLGNDNIYSSNIGVGGNNTLKDEETIQIFSQDIIFDLVKGRLNISQQDVVTKHPFPFKVRCKKVKLCIPKDENFQTVKKSLFPQNKLQDMKQFTFTMMREDITESKSDKKKVSPVIEGSNPIKRQFCVYFEWEDYIIISEKDKTTVYKCPFIFCFVTYYPFFTFFRDILCHMISKIQQERKPYIDNLSKSYQPFISCDMNWVIQKFNDENSIYKKKLLELQLNQPEIQQTIHFNIEVQDSSKPQIMDDDSFQQNINNQKQNSYSSKVSFMVPHYRQLRLLETSQYSGSYLILQLLTFDDFWFILSLIMLEQQVVFISSNIQYVAGALQTFSSIFKPFNKSMLILHFFEDSFTYLETPTPYIGGINQSSDYIFGSPNRSICEDWSHVNFIDFDQKKITMSYETLQLFENNKAFMDYPKYFYQLRKTYNIITVYHQNKTSSFQFKFHNGEKPHQKDMYYYPLVIQNFDTFRANNQQSNQFLPDLTATAPNIQNIEQKNSKPSKNLSNSSNQLFKKDLFNDKGAYSLAQDNPSVFDEITSRSIVEQQRSVYQQYIKEAKTKALEEIYDLLEQTFHHYIIDNLPYDQTIDVNSKHFNAQEFLERIIKHCEEQNFTRLFLYTQNFSYFYQQFYENIYQKPSTSSTKITANSAQNKI